MKREIAAFAVLATCATSACAEDTPTALTPVEEWAAVPEYEIGDEMEGDALFNRIYGVGPAADGSRVYVLDGEAVEVTIWTPDGTLIERVGRRGEGPGEFRDPGRLFLFDDGFQVIERRRVTTFSLDGDVVRTDGLERAMAAQEPGSASFEGYHTIAMFEDRSLGALATPGWAMMGSVPEEGSEDLPVVRITRADGSFGVETLGLLNVRDTRFLFPGEESFGVNQPWIRPDHFAMDPWNGSVVFSRPLRTDPGVLELLDVSIAGDTLWTRRIHLPPIPVTGDDVEAAVDDHARFAAGGSGNTVSPRLRDRIRDAFIIPDYWPATNEIRLMSNGEIWCQPAGDDPGIWYAVRKGEDDEPIRRIIAPESFRPLNANATHVWGVRTDELGVQYVAGLRLVREIDGVLP